MIFFFFLQTLISKSKEQYNDYSEPKSYSNHIWKKNWPYCQCNKAYVDSQYQMRCNISHLDFNLILLPSPADEKWVSWVWSVFSSSLENDAAYAVLIGSNFLWAANSVNDWPLPCYVMSALPLHLMYMSLIFCPLAITLPKLSLTFENALSVDFCQVWAAFGGFTLYPAVLRSMEITILKGGRSQSSKQNVCWHTWEILAPDSISTLSCYWVLQSMEMG